MSGGNWQQSSTAAAPAWTATAAVAAEDDSWGGGRVPLSSPDYAYTLGSMATSPAGTVASVASSQEFALMGSLAGAEDFVSEQARSSSVPADMYFGGEQQHQQMSHLSEHIESVLDEESFPL